MTLSRPEGSVEAYALMDEGSAVTLLDEGVAKKIGTTVPKGILKLAYINATREVPSQRVNLAIQGRQKGELLFGECEDGAKAQLTGYDSENEDH